MPAQRQICQFTQQSLERCGKDKNKKRSDISRYQVADFRPRILPATRRWRQWLQHLQKLSHKLCVKVDYYPGDLNEKGRWIKTIWSLSRNSYFIGNKLMMISSIPFCPLNSHKIHVKPMWKMKIHTSSFFYSDEYSRKKMFSWKATMCGLLVNWLIFSSHLPSDQKSSSWWNSNFFFQPEANFLLFNWKWNESGLKCCAIKCVISGNGEWCSESVFSSIDGIANGIFLCVLDYFVDDMILTRCYMELI